MPTKVPDQFQMAFNSNNFLLIFRIKRFADSLEFERDLGYGRMFYLFRIVHYVTLPTVLFARYGFPKQYTKDLT